MAKLILVSAAQTDWTAQGRLSGDVDVPLNEVGHQQALVDAQAVAGLHPGSVFCGPEQATQQTATILAGELKLKVRALKELREMDLGHWEGLTIDDFRERFAKVYRQWRLEPMSVEPPKGEAVSDVAARLTQGVRKSLKKQDNGPVAFVLGQFACAIARCELEDGDYEKFWDYVDGDQRWHTIDLKPNGETKPVNPDGADQT